MSNKQTTTSIMFFHIVEYKTYLSTYTEISSIDNRQTEY